jgi:anti-sigma regulatory factor (Ser/Thr protein kinase)
MHTDDEYVEVRLDRDADSWVLEVAGADGLRDVNPTQPGTGQIGGRGLFIVNTVMDDVAIVTGPSGRLVRCVKYVDS